MSDGNMTYEDWLRGCVHHDGRHGYVTLPCDEVLKIADFIERLMADRKTEPTISKMEQVEDEPMKTTDYCDICKRDMCEICIADATNPYCVPSHYEINYEPKDEPQGRSE